MGNLSVKQKIYGAIAILLVVILVSGIMIFSAISSSRESLETYDAMGRQRMLSQAMGKAGLGYAMAKSRKKTIEQQIASLDRYITQMRGTYTRTIIGTAKKSGLAISMNPENEPHPAVPFPATFTRLTNEKFGEGRDFGIDIISDALSTLKNNLKLIWIKRPIHSCSRILIRFSIRFMKRTASSILPYTPQIKPRFRFAPPVIPA